MLFLSIIVPTFNRAHLIEKTLLSLLNQTVDEYEIIVVDDGSTDNTKEVVEKLRSHKIKYFKTANGERAKARNTGTKLARGEYVNWFDSDDLALPNHCETILTAIRENKYPEMIRLDYVIYDTLKDKQQKVFHKKNTRHDILKGNSFGTTAVVVNRKIALLNPFNEDLELSVSEDYELWLRLMSKYEVVTIPIVTSWLVEHHERSVVTQMKNAEVMEKRFLKLIAYALNNPETEYYIGKTRRYFIMRNYLTLAVDLAYNNHKSLAKKYLKLAFKINPRALEQRVFWATLKHLLL